ncbi:sulfite exporter TauE/SafE family protein [Myxococcus landrumensis]|uniref:Probable membrane transporter protein n=1 Tax=Myxococcus landrumensis TaxID=2813577 RepID=A0ABX7MZE6_9BACT|nr:sulfite exporter TauE/SafE family protein [Myxococcus landrumus]QSQ11795.1 sulfite exporter TauE/SafE family protein [Myxococcus landrumus]
MMLFVGLAGALLVGVLLGLLGGGGSILTVPLLVYVLGVEPRTAIAMSLVVVGVTSANGAWLHARAGRVRWRTAFVFGAGGMVGAFLGGKLNPLLSPTALMVFFAGVMVAASVAMLLRSDAPAASQGAPASEPSGTAASTVSASRIGRVLLQGVGVGILSGLVGAGGGFLIVPALAMVGLPTPVATATSLVVIALQCAAGLMGHLGHLDLPWVLTAQVIAVALVGSLVGGRLAGRVAPGLLRRGFAVFVLATATFLLLAQLPAGAKASMGQVLSNVGAWPWVAVATLLGLPVVVWRLLSGRERTAKEG